MILKRTKTIMRKFYQMSRTFLKKLVPCRESNSGSLRWLRASVPLLLITAGNPFPRFNHFHHRARKYFKERKLIVWVFEWKSRCFLSFFLTFRTLLAATQPSITNRTGTGNSEIIFALYCPSFLFALHPEFLPININYIFSRFKYSFGV